MNTQQKMNLKKGLMAKIEKLGISQNEAAKRIGVSGATITNVKSEKWDNITDAWKKIQMWVGSDGWQIVETPNIKRIINFCNHAQAQGITKAVSFRQGSGKSCGAKHYANNHRNVFYLEAEPHYTKKVFLSKLCRVMGLGIDSSIADMVDVIVDKLNTLEKPLIIIDEFDQLKETVLPFFKTFYNKAKSGFVLIGGEHFPKRINKGVRLSKQSYCEIYSRLGAEFLGLHNTNKDMITAVCEANGLFDKKVINQIVIEAKGDLRRVKNDIEKYQLLTRNKGTI